MSSIAHRYGAFTLLCALGLVGLAPIAQAADGAVFVRIETGTADTDFSIGGDKSSHDDRGFNVRGGYYFTPNIAAEGFYSQFYNAQVFGSRFFWDISTDAQLRAYGAGVVGKWRFGEDRGFYVQGRAGMARVTGDMAFTYSLCAGLRPCPRTDTWQVRTTEPYYGVAVGYDFNEHVGVGLHYDVLDADFDGDISSETRTLGLGVEYRF